MAVSKPLYIIDASVILKWFFEEEDKNQAFRLQYDYYDEQIALGVPSFAFSEVLNIIGFKVTLDKAVACCSRLLNFNLNEYPVMLGLSSVAFEIMQKVKGVSFYDAYYHAIAIQEGGTFVTADEKYYRKARKHGSIMLLKHYGKKR